MPKPQPETDVTETVMLQMALGAQARAALRAIIKEVAAEKPDLARIKQIAELGLTEF